MAYYGSGFNNILYLWQSWGLSDVILPFLLIFSIVFAVLQKMKLFGDKKVNTIIALVLGLSTVLPHTTGWYPYSFDAVEIINAALPQIAVILVALVMVLILVGMFSHDGALWLVALFAIAIVGYIFARAADWVPAYELLYILEDPGVQALVVILLVFGFIVWLIAGSGPKTPGESMMKGAAELVNKLFRF